MMSSEMNESSTLAHHGEERHDIHMHEKITIAEAIKWLENAKISWLSDGLPMESTDFTTVCFDLKPVGFKAPRKPRTSNGSNTIDRCGMEFDPDRCSAGVWIKDARDRGQCSCRPSKGNILCSRHQHEAEKHGGKIKNGLITSARPTHEYDQTDNPDAIIIWHDVDGYNRKSTPSASTAVKKPRKCSRCGVNGHNKAKCPNDVVDTNNTPITADQLANMEYQLPSAISDGDPQITDGDTVETVVHDALPVDGDNDGDCNTMDLELASSDNESAVSGLEELTLEEDTSEYRLKSLRETQMERTLSLVQNSIEDTSVNEILFEGVSYTVDDDMDVYDDECDKIGTWDGESIDFATKKDRKIHDSSKKMIHLQ
jgi:hypothetical protein